MKKLVGAVLAFAAVVVPSVTFAESIDTDTVQLASAVEMTDAEMDQVAAGIISVVVAGNQVLSQNDTQVQAQVGVLSIQGQQQRQ
jgi:hypothetical protein